MFQDLLSLFFPEHCAACQTPLCKGEQTVCAPCRFKMPLTDFHTMQESPVARIFRGRAPVDAAASMLHFNKGEKTQKMIHRLKYRNCPEIGIFLGEWYGYILNHWQIYSTIDWIVPVPLHPDKESVRR